MEQKDFYKILGLEKDADSQQIKAAYRKLAFQYHPDKNKDDPQNAEKMKSINEAYAVLSDPQKRREYDTMRQQFGSGAYNHFRNQYTEQDIFDGSDIFKIFEEMTRSFGFRGYDEIFREFYGNGYHTFEFKKPGFSARGFVYQGRGKGRRQVNNRHEQEPLSSPFAPKMGKFSRYLFKKISGVDFPEQGADRSDSIELTPEKAQKGGPHAYYDTRKKKKIVVQIPPGIREGKQIRLAGMGEEGKGGASAGDLYLKVTIKKSLMEKMKNFIHKHLELLK
jgi:DnaJ-class molecular chaperone